MHFVFRRLGKQGLMLDQKQARELEVVITIAVKIMRDKALSWTFRQNITWEKLTVLVAYIRSHPPHDGGVEDESGMVVLYHR